MMPDMHQQGGEDSTNYQAGGSIIIHQHGLTLQEARQVALDVIKANSRELMLEAADIFRGRIGQLVDHYLTALSSNSPHQMASLRDPDMQYALISAGIAYGRSGEEYIENTLVELLVERASLPERSLKQIILNEAIAIAPRLMKYQLNILSLTLIFRNMTNERIRTIQGVLEFLDQAIIPFVFPPVRESGCYEHLQHVNCGYLPQNPVFELSSSIIALPFFRAWAGLFSNGFTEDDVVGIMQLNDYRLRQLLSPCFFNMSLLQLDVTTLNELSSRLKEMQVDDHLYTEVCGLYHQSVMHIHEMENSIIELLPSIWPLVREWDSTQLNSIMLTNVGIALAKANIRQTIKEPSNVVGWFDEWLEKL
jgi:hypothetical protein